MVRKKKKKGKHSKDKAQYIHAQRRALERYDLEYTNELKEGIIAKIMNGNAAFVDRQSNRVSIFDVEVQGKSVRVVYDKQRKNIASFIPKEQKGAPPMLLGLKAKDIKNFPTADIVSLLNDFRSTDLRIDILLAAESEYEKRQNLERKDEYGNLF